jgi:hypothetical protein
MKGILTLAWLILMGICIWASLKIPLWVEWSALRESPWFLTTLVDLYVGLILFACFSYLLNRSWKHSAIWSLLFFCGGNLTTLIWVYLNREKIREKLR